MFSHSVLNPMSPQALAISKLFVFILIAAGANLLGLVGTLAITLPLYRHRKGQGDPPPTFGRFDMEIAWTSAPFIILKPADTARYRSALALALLDTGALPKGRVVVIASLLNEIANQSGSYTSSLITCFLNTP